MEPICCSETSVTKLPTSPRNIPEEPRPRNTRTWMCLQTLRHSGLLQSVVWRKFWRNLLPHLQNARVAYLHGKYQSVQRHISKYRSLDIHDREKPKSHACQLTWHFRLQTPGQLGFSTLTSVFSPPPPLPPTLCGTVAGIATRLLVWGSGVRIPTFAHFCCHQTVQTDSGIHPATYSVRNGVLCRGKAVGKWSWPLTSI